MLRASLLLLLSSCALPLVDDDGERLCLDWNDALAAYYRRCGIDDAQAGAWLSPKRAKCPRAIVGDVAAAWSCVANIEQSDCNIPHPSCDAIKYRPFVL